MPGEQERDYDIPLATGDVIRSRFTSVRGQIQKFTVQLEVFADDEFRPAVRYDTAHGFAHRDLLDWHGNVIDKEPLPEWMSLNEALTYAQQQLRSNAEAYRTAFLGRKP